MAHGAGTTSLRFDRVHGSGLGVRHGAPSMPDAVVSRPAEGGEWHADEFGCCVGALGCAPSKQQSWIRESRGARGVAPDRLSTCSSGFLTQASPSHNMILMSVLYY